MTSIDSRDLRTYFIQIEALEELRGMNTSWSHHRLSDLQRQAARFRQSRPSMPDTTKHYRVHLSRIDVNFFL